MPISVREDHYITHVNNKAKEADNHNTHSNFATSRITNAIRRPLMTEQGYQQIQLDLFSPKGQQAIDAYQNVQLQAQKDALLGLVGVDIFV